ncbi:hypothetical protein [Azospirillum canadense]|uniref:hypothetical protein n=1 Tax=Azospirillum canadense TaxID=403962 RepID=UPI002227412C|nr:hypothetical protein [Azospirillum canadense]MCW2241843.1 hypothetical protein [Azospirillum canadense]
MRYVNVATASMMLLLAGCASGMNDQSSTGFSGASSGNSGVSNQIISPNERGMGQSMTRRSLGDATEAGSGSSTSTYYGTGQSRTDNRTTSPNERGMGQSMTRQSLPNPSGTQW